MWKVASDIVMGCIWVVAKVEVSGLQLGSSWNRSGLTSVGKVVDDNKRSCVERLFGCEYEW